MRVQQMTVGDGIACDHAQAQSMGGAVSEQHTAVEMLAETH
jgi:hypothetical protein